MATKIPTTPTAAVKVSANGRNGKRRSDGKVRVAIVGVGNCASSLVQGRYYYENARPGDDIRRMGTTDVTRVSARHSDSVINGALIGAGAAVASGLFLCRLTESWENCRDDVGPMLRIGALGAGIGIGIDALIRGRKTIYEAPGSARLSAAPIVARRGGGLQLSLSF